MPISDPEACVAFVFANRLIADRLKEKAEELLEVTQSLEDVEQRLRLADLMVLIEERAAYHTSIAELQDSKMGIECHCPQRTSRTM